MCRHLRKNKYRSLSNTSHYSLRYRQLVTPPSPSLARSILEGGSLGADWKGVLGRRDLLGRRRLDGVRLRLRLVVRVGVRVRVRVRVRFRFRVILPPIRGNQPEAIRSSCA